MAFASAQQGWIAGGQGTLWFTLDGGTTWSYLGTDQSETITALSAPQAGTVWAAGFKHTVLRSQGAAPSRAVRRRPSASSRRSTPSTPTPPTWWATAA
ncbi:MAG: hypothetical protein HZY76_03885 [Anaerolineae bacterium]|nr:MAG: hypothetical protein HZY76_03885 [Anaerolineae bacterium]